MCPSRVASSNKHVEHRRQILLKILARPGPDRRRSRRGLNSSQTEPGVSSLHGPSPPPAPASCRKSNLSPYPLRRKIKPAAFAPQSHTTMGSNEARSRFRASRSL